MKTWTLIAATSLFSIASTAHATTLTQLDHHQKITETFSKKQIKKMYLGHTRHLEDGTRLRLTCLENGELHRTFLKEWVGMTPSQFKIHWQKKVFTGKGRMPAKFKNNTHQQSFVSQTPGAIGYKPTWSSASIRTGPVYFDPKTSRYIRAKRS